MEIISGRPLNNSTFLHHSDHRRYLGICRYFPPDLVLAIRTGDISGAMSPDQFPAMRTGDDHQITPPEITDKFQTTGIPVQIAGRA
jgi:hypothetical protein